MKKVAIVGAEEHTRDNAPWDDETFDIFMVNEWAMESWAKRYTASVDIHWQQIYTDPKYDRGIGYWEWLKQPRGKPVYMIDVDAEVPDSVKYPLDEINKEFLSNLTYEDRPVKNFRSSVSYCIALALYQGYKQIDLYGIELVGHEYKGQLSNFAFWVGVAVGRKVKINLHCSRGTFIAPLYGYEAFVKHSMAYQYKTGLLGQVEEQQKKLNMLQGALQLAEQMLEQEQGDDVENIE